MSPLGRAAYSREVKTLPSSYHTGCTQTSHFNRKSDIRGDGDPEALQGSFQLISPLFFRPLSPNLTGKTIQLSCVKAAGAVLCHNGCDVAQLLDPRWMNDCALRRRQLYRLAGDAEEEKTSHEETV